MAGGHPGMGSNWKGCKMAVMDSQYINGGTIGPGASFDDGNVFEGVTIIAPSTFGAGNTFINVTWKCLERCKRGPCGCCGDVSTVGPGSVTVGNTGDHVEFENTGTAANFSDGGCTLLTLPGCVDCAPRPSETNGSGISTTGTEVVVSDRGVLTYADWCKKCGRAGAVIQPDKAELAP
jgi:hypothetical protein